MVFAFALALSPRRVTISTQPARLESTASLSVAGAFTAPYPAPQTRFPLRELRLRRKSFPAQFGSTPPFLFCVEFHFLSVPVMRPSSCGMRLADRPYI